ncbi:MAG TPA: hypothetical protein VGI81_20450 [Tepidisphaeraceae bacterium]|jgi:hypothetical protein
MGNAITYGSANARRLLSRSAIASVACGVIAFPSLLYGLSVPAGTLSSTTAWLYRGSLFAIALIGLACGVVALAVRRRLWWLALVGVILSGSPLAMFAYNFHSFYRMLRF